MKTIKTRSPRSSSKPTLTRAASLASTRDADASNTAAATASQPRKQKTLDSFLVPKTHQLTAEQRRQQRRERRERKERIAPANGAAHHTAAVGVDGVEEEDGRQRRMKEAEIRERQRAMKEERMDSDDEEDIPLFRITPPTLPSSMPAPSTPSSSSQSQSSMPSSLSSSLSLTTPSTASPARRLKDEDDDDDEWDQIPAFVLQPQQSRLPPPLRPPHLQALPAPHQPPPLVPETMLSRPPPPSVPFSSTASPVTAPATVNPFAQSTSVSLSSTNAPIKGEWDDTPRVRLPLSQILQSLSEAKAAVRVKLETGLSLHNKENRPPFIADPITATPPAKLINALHSSPPSLSSPPPLEQATQREPSALQRQSSAASEQSVDSISSVEDQGPVIRRNRVKRERLRAPTDDIEDEHNSRQRNGADCITRAALFPPRDHTSHQSSSSSVPTSSAGHPAPSFFALPPSARSLHQPQPVHPHNGISQLLTSPPAPSFQPDRVLSSHPSSHDRPLYAGPVESWPLPFPQPEDDSKQPSEAFGGGYSFRGISELQGQAAVNYGQIFQPKSKRKRRSSEQKEQDEQRAATVKPEKKKKKAGSSKRRKTEGEADDEEEAKEERKDGGGERKKGGLKKKRPSGRWCTVNGVRTYIVGGRRLIGSAAYMAYKQENGGSSSSKKDKTTKATKRKGSAKKRKAKKERRRPDGSDSEAEWQPGDAEDSGGGESESGDESMGSLADFIVGDDFIESASSEDK